VLLSLSAASGQGSVAALAPPTPVRRCSTPLSPVSPPPHISMSRKPQRPSAPAGKKGGDDERADSLQAVVRVSRGHAASAADCLGHQILADSYETRFNPFTLERPRVWLPSPCGL